MRTSSLWWLIVREIKRMRSSKLGELKLVVVEPGIYSVTLPALDEIDLLVIE